MSIFKMGKLGIISYYVQTNQSNTVGSLRGKCTSLNSKDKNLEVPGINKSILFALSREIPRTKLSVMQRGFSSTDKTPLTD